MIDYEDLVKQLTQFRLDVINALSEIDVELDTLQKAVTSGKKVTEEDLKSLRQASRKKLGRFQEYSAQRLALLHERREGH